MMKTIGWIISLALLSLPIYADISPKQPQFGNIYSNDGLNRYRQQIELEQQKRVQRLKNYDNNLTNLYQSRGFNKLN